MNMIKYFLYLILGINYIGVILIYLLYFIGDNSFKDLGFPIIMFNFSVVIPSIIILIIFTYLNKNNVYKLIIKKFIYLNVFIYFIYIITVVIYNYF